MTHILHSTSVTLDLQMIIGTRPKNMYKIVFSNSLIPYQKKKKKQNQLHNLRPNFKIQKHNL